MSHFNAIDYAVLMIVALVGIRFFIGYSQNIGQRLRRGYAFLMLGLGGWMGSVVMYVIANHLSLPQLVIWALPVASTVFVIGGTLVHYMVSTKLWFKNRKLVKLVKKAEYGNLDDLQRMTGEVK